MKKATTKSAIATAEHKTKKITVKDWHKNNPGYEYLKPGFKGRLEDYPEKDCGIIEMQILRTTVSMSHRLELNDDDVAITTKVPKGQLRMLVIFFRDGKEMSKEDIIKFDLSDRYYLVEEEHEIWGFYESVWARDLNGNMYPPGEIECESQAVKLPKQNLC